MLVRKIRVLKFKTCIFSIFLIESYPSDFGCYYFSVTDYYELDTNHTISCFELAQKKKELF